MSHDSVIQARLSVSNLGENLETKESAQFSNRYNKLNEKNSAPFYKSLNDRLPSLEKFKNRSASNQFEILLEAFNGAKELALKRAQNPKKAPQLPKVLKDIYKCIERLRLKLLNAPPNFAALKKELDKKIVNFNRIRAAFQRSRADRIVSKLEEFDAKKNSCEFWRKLRSLRGEKPAVNCFAVKNEQGKLSTTKDEYKNFWKEHFEKRYKLPRVTPQSTNEAELLNTYYEIDTLNYFSACLDSSITEADFDYALKKLR